MSQRSNTRFYIFAIGMILFSAFLFITGFVRLGTQDEKLSICTEQITATFTGYNTVKRSSGRGKSRTVRYPRYEYEYLGRHYEVESDTAIASTNNMLSEGDKVTMFISPDSPEVFCVPGDSSGSVQVAYIFVGGGVFLILGIVLILECVHEQRQFKKHSRGYGYP